MSVEVFCTKLIFLYKFNIVTFTFVTSYANFLFLVGVVKGRCERNSWIKFCIGYDRGKYSHWISFVFINEKVETSSPFFVEISKTGN